MRGYIWLLTSICLLTHVISTAHAEVDRFTGDESLPPAVIYLADLYHNYTSFDLYGANGTELLKMATGGNLDETYLPENRPKYPLPYYLIPDEDARFLFADSLDGKVHDQLLTHIDGKRYYKLFVHPNSEEYYQHLKELGVEYVGPEKTEFMATSTTSHRSLIVWQPKKKRAKPFIAKLSLNRASGNENRVLSQSEVERSVTNQRALDKLGRKQVQEMGLDYFPESAGLNLAERLKGKYDFLGGQIIREIPDVVLKGKELWIPFGVLMSQKPEVPLLIEVIKASGMSATDFVRQVLIYDFLDAYAEIAFKQGFNITTHSQNMGLILNPELAYAGRFSFQDYGGKRPHLLQMLVAGDLGEVYRQVGAQTNHRFDDGAKEVHGTNFMLQYKEWVFRKFVYETLPQHFPELEEKSVRVALMEELKREYRKLLSSHRWMPNASMESKNYRNVEADLLNNMFVDQLLDLRTASRVPFLEYDGRNRNTYEPGKLWRDKKSDKGERTAFVKSGQNYVSYATDDGIYVTSNNKIVSFYFFTPEEKRLYQEYGPENIDEFYSLAAQLTEEVSNEGTNKACSYQFLF